MTTLTLIYLRDTGSGLAAVSRATRPATTEPVAALVGPRLPWQRAGDPQHAMAFTVAADRLAAATFDDEPFPDDPSSRGVLERKQNNQVTHELVTLQAGSKVSFTGSSLTVTVPATATEALPVVVVVQKELATPPVPSPLFLSGSIPAFSSQVTLTPSLDTGTWNAVAFVKGFTPTDKQGTV
jgi:hypothetical protein